MSIEIPQQLVTSALDLTPLVGVLTSISRRLDEVFSSVSALQKSQRTMAEELAETVQRVNVSHKHLEVMFETVGACNKKVLELERTSVTKEDANSKFGKLEEELVNMTESVRKLSVNKIDKTSEELEIRVRLAASEACVSYLNKRDAETKEYVKTTLDASEQKVIRIAYARAEDVASKTDIRCVQLGHRIDDVLQAIHAVRRDAEQETINQTALDRTLVSKLEQHEVFMSKLDEGLSEETDEIATALHVVMQRVLGVSLSDLQVAIQANNPPAEAGQNKSLIGAESSSATANPQDGNSDGQSSRGVLLVVPDEQLLRMGFKRQTRRVTRAVELTKGWRNVRSASGKVLLAAPIACSNLDAGIDLAETTAYRKIDQALAAELKAVLSEGAEKRAATLAKRYPVEILPRLRSAPLLQDISATSRTVTESTVLEQARALEKAFADQVENLTKEVRGKMSNNKAMELIDQRTTRMLSDAMVPATSAIEHLSRNSISRSEVFEALSNKADVSRLEVKADPAYVQSVADDVRSEVNMSLSDLKDMYQKLLSEVTLFRHKQLIDDRTGAPLNSADGAILAGAAGDPSAEPALAAGVVSKCLSCRQPLPPGNTRGQSAASRLAQNETAIQDSQKQVHESQIKQGQSRTPSKPSAAGSSSDGQGGVLGQWVSGIETKYIAHPQVSLSSGKAQSGPRPPSAK